MAKTAVRRGRKHFVSRMYQFVSYCFAHARRGVVSVEYAEVIGTLAATIIAVFTGLAGRLLEILLSLTF